ncbi:MAG TPA: PEGA domain-containing protein, partial [Patescibacteria group bacterium]|nr:PEGA domain-containing protein [Patescibacteria group bacterium]
MTKIRVILFLITVLVIGTAGFFFSFYARGYKFNPKTLKFSPSGLLLIKSNPDGAQIFINGELKTVTNVNLSLAPGTYDIDLKKEGYNSWTKRLTIEKEIVTEIEAHLFKKTPSLSPLTFTTSLNPISSYDSTKIAYSIPATIDNINQDKEG